MREMENQKLNSANLGCMLLYSNLDPGEKKNFIWSMQWTTEHCPVWKVGNLQQYHHKQKSFMP